MSKTQEQIDKMRTLISQNGELINTNSKLVNSISSFMPSDELHSGKQLIVNAINTLGGSASMEDSLAVLAKKIKRLDFISTETRLHESVPKPINISHVLNYREYICSFKSETLTKLLQYSFGGASRLEEFYAPNVEEIGSECITRSKIKKIAMDKIVTITGNSNFAYNSSLEEASFKALKKIPSYNFLVECRNLHTVDFINIESYEFRTFDKCDSLVDLIIGKGIKGNFAMNYNPTNAYSKTSASLCFSSDIDKYGRTFDTNWSKWKWCIINHFAANLEDRVGLTSFTITFGNTVLSQFDEEMVEAFTSKNWTLA